MKIAFLKETDATENRVACVPEVVSRYIALGFEVLIESGAGMRSCFADEAYRDAGAQVVSDAAAACAGADIVVCVNAPSDAVCKFLRRGQLLVAQMHAFSRRDLVERLASSGVDVVALELMPRITRAQSMDILSSQNNIAGYKAVMVAAAHLRRAFPMMMTAAGTVAPVRVLVMGVGVAGLQAIATAKRLGAIVSATDVRAATKEQVESLAAQFIAVEDEEFLQAQTAGGYAKAMSEDYMRKQAALVSETLIKQDVVITTALVPGRAAPRLIDSRMLATMKAGSVVIDMATAAGGNCEGSELGNNVVKGGVTIIDGHNLASSVPQTTSLLLAKNILAFVDLLADSENKQIRLNVEDDIIKEVLAVYQNAVFSPTLRQLWS